VMKTGLRPVKEVVRMPLGLILLLAVAALIYFGFAHRVLDRMRLTDAQALGFIGLMIAGSFIDIPLARDTASISVNVGGGILPVLLAVYLLARADERYEWVRALASVALTAGVIYGVSRVYDFGPEAPQTGFIDPVWLFGLLGGAIAYLAAGRSRRSAFIAGSLGILVTDFIHLGQALVRQVPATVAIGGAGAFDTIVLGGIIAVGLAELTGEIRERIQGGPAGEENDVDTGGEGDV